MKKHIAVLAGDGIGPEIVPQALNVLKTIGQRFGHDFELTYGDLTHNNLFKAFK